MTAANIVDIIIAVIIVFSLSLGYRRGLVRTILSFLTLAVAVIASSVFGPDVGEMIKETAPYENVTELVSEELSKRVEDIFKEENVNLADKGDELFNSPLAEKLEDFGVDKAKLRKMYDKAIGDGSENAAEKLVARLSDTVSNFIANAMGILIVFVAAFVGMMIVGVIVNGIVKLPILNSVNRIGGLFAGLVLGIVFVTLLCILAEFLIPYIPENPVIYKGLENDSVLYGIFSNLNPMILLFFA